MKQTSQDAIMPLSSVAIRRRKARSSAIGWIVGFCQISAARICRLYLQINGGYTLRSSIPIDPSRRYLFVANHQSQLDPFSVFAALPFRSNINAAPVRFLTAKTVYYTPLLPLLKSFGCYPTRGHREQIIAESVGYLRDGYNVFIFPEGKRTTEKDSEPRRGVSDLIRSATEQMDVTMVLVHIDWQLLGRGRKHVTISLKEAPKDLYKKDAVTIMKQLYRV